MVFNRDDGSTTVFLFFFEYEKEKSQRYTQVLHIFNQSDDKMVVYLAFRFGFFFRRGKKER